MLKSLPTGGFDSAGDLIATVESVADVGYVLFVRFYEGPAAFAGSQPPSNKSAEERLEVVLNSLKGINQLMGTMAPAIRKAAAVASGAQD